MDLKLPSYFHLSRDVARGLAANQPVVALESTVITHGLPFPENLRIAQAMEDIIRDKDVVPATIAVLDGIIHVGIDTNQLERLASGEELHKISSRDLAGAVTKSWSGGTTVAATLVIANMAGIQVFATGGIGGVHWQPPFDVSADLYQLARNPVVIVCAGAKAILDIPATVEYLETVSVPVIGFQTGEFPAFYSRKSGMKTSARAETAKEIAELAKTHWDLRLSSAVLVALPPPEGSSLPAEMVQKAIQDALLEAEQQGVRGQDVTPYLLERVSELTGGASMRTNLDLLQNNARLAADIAPYLNQEPRRVRL